MRSRQVTMWLLRCCPLVPSGDDRGKSLITQRREMGQSKNDQILFCGFMWDAEAGSRPTGRYRRGSHEEAFSRNAGFARRMPRAWTIRTTSASSSGSSVSCWASVWAGTASRRRGAGRRARAFPRTPWRGCPLRVLLLRRSSSVPGDPRRPTPKPGCRPGAHPLRRMRSGTAPSALPRCAASARSRSTAGPTSTVECNAARTPRT